MSVPTISHKISVITTPGREPYVKTLLTKSLDSGWSASARDCIEFLRKALETAPIVFFDSGTGRFTAYFQKYLFVTTNSKDNKQTIQDKISKSVVNETDRITDLFASFLLNNLPQLEQISSKDLLEKHHVKFVSYRSPAKIRFKHTNKTDGERGVVCTLPRLECIVNLSIKVTEEKTDYCIGLYRSKLEEKILKFIQ